MSTNISIFDLLTITYIDGLTILLYWWTDYFTSSSQSIKIRNGGDWKQLTHQIENIE